jgi:signal transduction histidine kinase/FixJ family two-component response regulator
MRDKNGNSAGGRLDEEYTQSIDLTSLFTKDLTTTGSFDVSSGIWQTTFGKVLQALPIPVLLIDTSYRTIMANQAWARIDKRYGETVYCPFSELFPTDSLAKKAQAILEEVFERRKSRMAQASLEIGNRKIWTRMTFRSIRIGSERFVLVLIEDLTVDKQLLEANKRHSEELEKTVRERTAQLKAMNEQLQKEIVDRKKAEDLWLQSERLKLIGELASGTAHNFNNTLQIVLSGAQVALLNIKSGNHAKAEEALGQVIQSAGFGAETVRRLQSFTSIRDDQRTVTHEVFDVCEVVRPAVELTKAWWKTLPEKQGISVDLQLLLRDRCPISGKRDEIFEVVVNLIKNAAEALPHGGLIEVKCWSGENEVILKVLDTGKGIPREMLSRLFIPFSTTKVTAGAGLGLATAEAMVRNHGGDISVETVEGKGSIFTVTLPKAAELPKEPATASTQIEERPLKILVIDDVEEVVNLLADGLSLFNHAVHKALSGQEGLEIFMREAIDVVICDLGMPQMTGWDVSRQVMNLCRDRGVPKTPFVLLTGWGDQIRETEKMRSAGVDRVITKPIDVSQAMDVIYALVTNAEILSHSACPDDALKLYPEMFADKSDHHKIVPK